MNTPTTVLAAFAPETEMDLTLEGVLVLESIGCAYINGGTPSLRDAVLVYLSMIDLPAVKAARRTRTVDDLIESWAAGFRPADLIELQPSILQSVAAAFAPIQGSAEADTESDTIEKKSNQAAAGG